MHARESIVMEVSGIDPDKFIFEGIDTTNGPRFGTNEVAKFFFARTAHWMRWREQRGHFVLDSVPVNPERKNSGVRSYTLGDIEHLAHALASNGAITGQQLSRTLMALKLQGEMNGLIA